MCNSNYCWGGLCEEMILESRPKKVTSGGGTDRGNCNCKGPEAGLGLWRLRNGEVLLLSSLLPPPQVARGPDRHRKTGPLLWVRVSPTENPPKTPTLRTERLHFSTCQRLLPLLSSSIHPGLCGTGAGPFMVLAQAASVLFYIEAIQPRGPGPHPVLGACGCLGLRVSACAHGQASLGEKRRKTGLQVNI